MGACCIGTRVRDARLTTRVCGGGRAGELRLGFVRKVRYLRYPYVYRQKVTGSISFLSNTFPQLAPALVCAGFVTCLTMIRLRNTPRSRIVSREHPTFSVFVSTCTLPSYSNVTKISTNTMLRTWYLCLRETLVPASLTLRSIGSCGVFRPSHHASTTCLMQ